MRRWQEREWADIYMEGWKISKIVQMFTGPLKRPECDPNNDKIERDKQQRHNTSPWRLQLVEAEGTVYP